MTSQGARAPSALGCVLTGQEMTTVLPLRGKAIRDIASADPSLHHNEREIPMKRLGLLGIALLLLAGCAGPNQPDWMQDAMKDWNGDRMKMEGETVGPYSPPPGRTK